MIDLLKAKIAFKNYVSHYDATDSSIRLKMIHTYEVMKCSDYLCDQLHLSKEDKDLASLIALLHDIGRFEQWKQYHSFADYKTIDHALFSSQLLFEEGKIREFIEDHQYDDIIKNAIEQHNHYKVDEGFDERTLLFIHLIRDADKLDNYRVKEEETMETLLFASIEEVNQSHISPEIYDQIYQQQLVYAPTRKTKLDFWLSYIAFVFDLYFEDSIQYIKDHHWIERSFDRLHPIDKKTYEQYQTLRQRTLDYLK